MAVNVYESEQRIYFDSEKPTIYYGWYLSTTGDASSCEHFTSPAARERFVQQVGIVYPWLDQHYRLVVAAVLLLRYIDGDDYEEALEGLDLETTMPDFDWSDFIHTIESHL